MAHKQVCIVILNWNNGKDTIECLDTIFFNYDAHDIRLVICDNQSTDDSVDRIRTWADIHHVPVSEFLYKRFHNGRSFSHTRGVISVNRVNDSSSHVFLIHNGGNLGFASGNNAGILFALQNIDFDYLLLLNNDTLITPGAIEAMVARMETGPKVDMCGCKIVYHHTPDKVQAWGGARFKPLIGGAYHLGAYASVSVNPYPALVEQQLDYILGAAMMVSRRLIEDVGLMNEDYFLYFEEIDWSTRARAKGYQLGYADNSLIYHKEGGTIGSSYIKAKRSHKSDYYMLKSRMKFTLKFYPWFLPMVIGYSLLQVLRMLVRGDIKRVFTMLRGVAGLPLTKDH